MKSVYLVVLAAVILLTGCEADKKAIFLKESGTIETKSIILSSQLSGKILKLNVDEGDAIRKNDTLVVQDYAAYKFRLEQAEANSKMAKAAYNLVLKGARKEDIKQAFERLNQAEENLKNAEINYNRMKNLADENSITKKQFDDVRTAYNVAKSQLEAAKANYDKIKKIFRSEEIEQAEAQYLSALAGYKLALKQYNDCFITSPINGYVIETYREENETVAPLTSLVKISDQSVAELSVYVSETKVPLIKTGQTADVTIDAFSDKVFHGKVVFISPEAEFTPKAIQTEDERTKLVFRVKIEIPNDSLYLKHGLPADAIISLK